MIFFVCPLSIITYFTLLEGSSKVKSLFWKKEKSSIVLFRQHRHRHRRRRRHRRQRCSTTWCVHCESVCLQNVRFVLAQVAQLPGQNVFNYNYPSSCIRLLNRCVVLSKNKKPS